MAQVSGQVEFTGKVLTTIFDYQRAALELVRSKEVEDAIVVNITKAAVEHLGCDYDGLPKRVTAVYVGYRPGSSRAMTMPAFMRLSHLLAFCKELIVKLAPDGAVEERNAKPSKAEKAEKQGKDQGGAPGPSLTPSPLSAGGPAKG